MVILKDRAMARAARRYDLCLPITYNDGRRIEPELLDAVENHLLDRFVGLTVQQRKFPPRGIWQGQTQLFFDKILLITALDFRPRGSMRFMARLKVQLLADLAKRKS
jgi:hypothetical protein